MVAGKTFNTLGHPRERNRPGGTNSGCVSRTAEEKI